MQNLILVPVRVRHQRSRSPRPPVQQQDTTTWTRMELLNLMTVVSLVMWIVIVWSGKQVYPVALTMYDWMAGTL